MTRNRAGLLERRRSLARLSEAQSAAWERFWDVFLASVLPAFFDAMFEARGRGAEFYGRDWRPITAEWLSEKDRAGWDLRVGHRTLELREQLIKGVVRRVAGDTAAWGADPQDPLNGFRYAADFNSVRPIIDAITADELRAYIRQEAQAEFDRAAQALKEAFRGST